MNKKFYKGMSGLSGGIGYGYMGFEEGLPTFTGTPSGTTTPSGASTTSTPSVPSQVTPPINVDAPVTDTTAQAFAFGATDTSTSPDQSTTAPSAAATSPSALTPVTPPASTGGINGALAIAALLAIKALTGTK